MLAAVRQGSPVRIDDSLSGDSETYANPDGSLTLHRDLGTTRVKQADGSWADVDMSWQNVDGKVTERMPAAPVTLSAGGNDTVASTTAGTGTIDLGWDAPLPTPVLTGSTATYPNVRPGVDLVVDALRTGYEVNFVVHSRPTGPLTLPLTLNLHGLTATKASDGSVQVADGKGVVRARSAVPVMYGAAKDVVSHLPTQSAIVDDELSAPTASASPEVGSTEQTWSLAPDTNFLSDPATSYPVTVDPTFTVSPSSDTYVKSDVTTSQYSSPTLWMGTPDAGTTKARIYFHFNAIPSQINGMYIDSANLGLWNLYSSTCAASLATVSVYRMSSSSSWNSNTVWTNKPSPDTSNVWSSNFAYGGPSCATAGWGSVPITSLVQAWASGANTIRDWQVSGNETDTHSWKQFDSVDAPSHIPYVSITYRAYPGTPGQPTMSPALYAGGGVYWTNTLTPRLTSTVSSGTGSPVYGLFSIYQGSTLIWSGNGSSVTGSGTSKITVPSSSGMATNTQYLLRVWGKSGGAQSASWSNYLRFNVDTDNPTLTALTSTDFPSGVWTARTFGSFTVAGTDPSSGLDHFVYSLDNPSPTTATATGATSIRIDPMPGGWHTLYVAAVDKAGNRSAVGQYHFGANAGLTTPADGTVTQQYVTLTAQNQPTGGAGYVTYYYRRADVDNWSTPPTSDVHVTSSGPTFSAWPYLYETTSDTTGIPASLTWDVKNTLSGVDGPVQVAVCFGDSTACPASPGASLPAGASTVSRVTLDQKAFNVAATTSLPVGQANLLTGNYQVSESDVSVPGNQGETLSVGRTFNTAMATTSGSSGAPSSGVFGPGWTASLPVESVGSDWAALKDTGSVLGAVGSDQSTTSFAKSSAGTYVATGQDSDSGLAVAADVTTAGCDPTGDYYRCYDLTDLDGNTTVFRSVDGGSSGALPAASGSTSLPIVYQVYRVVTPASLDTTTYSYTGRGYISQILSPLPSSGANCTNVSSASTWAPGCRGLGFTYNLSDEVTAVTYQTSDGTNPLQVDVACYAYDATSHRLTDEWDPRDIATAASGSHPIACDPNNKVRPTHYTYDSGGRIASVTSAYQPSSTPLVGWTIGYDGSDRVSTVTRTHTDASGAEVTSVNYGVSIAPDTTIGHEAYRPDLQSSATGTWAQQDNPTTGTAVCPPGSPSTSNVGDLTYCTISYLDAAGQTVNTAQYSGSGAAGWHISTTEHDALGHVVRSLTADNREEALNPTGADGAALKLPTDTATASLVLSTINIYTPNLIDGQPDLTASFGPYHLVELNDGTTVNARSYTTTVYDNSTGDPFVSGGNEPGHPKDGVALLSYHLPVVSTTAASMSQDTSAAVTADGRTTHTKYYYNADYTGWTYRLPMQTITDPGGLGITMTTLYDAPTGRVTYTRMPSALADNGNSSAGTTHTIYYTAGTNSEDSSCGNKPLWDGLVCRAFVVNLTPTSGLPSLITTKTTTYDYLQRATGVDETSTTDTTHPRQTATIYGFNSTISSGVSANPYATTTERTAVTGGVGTAVPAATVTYDAATGLVTSTSNGTIADSTTYDNFGRVVSYTENTSATGAAANTTATSYDATHGWVTQTADAHISTAYTYNGGNERRGLVTTKAVTVGGTSVGSFTATYDANGGVASQTDPNSVVTALSRDENGQLVGLSATRSSSAWVSDLVVPSIFGQWRAHEGPAGQHVYGYDAAGRLALVNDTAALAGASCVARTYGYDADSNRTSSVAYPSASGTGDCQTSTGGVTTSHSYDAADRLLSAGGDAGIAYDTFGRITSVPSADASGGALSAAYFANDLVKSQTQGTTVQAFTLDAAGRLGGWTVTVGGTLSATKANHYDDASSDSPDWIAENAASTQWTANVTDILGGLGAVVDQSGSVTYQYANLHGDVVATSNSAVSSGAAVIGPDYGEFGTNPGSNTRYGWLGGKQRSSDDLGGITLMGVRLYAPLLGRFLQTDPVPGGSANAYDYTNQDPVNAFDLDGKAPIGHPCAELGGSGGVGIGVALGAGALFSGAYRAGRGAVSGLYGGVRHAGSAVHHAASSVWGWGTGWMHHKRYRHLHPEPKPSDWDPHTGTAREWPDYHVGRDLGFGGGPKFPTPPPGWRRWIYRAMLIFGAIHSGHGD